MMKKKRSKEQQQQEHLQKIISSLMFSNGDGSEPFLECREFMLDVVQTQLTEKLIGKARELAAQRGKATFGPLELVFAFRRHPILIKRLIAYVNITDLMPTLLSASTCENPIPGEEEEALDLGPEMQIGVKMEEDAGADDDKMEENLEEESTSQIQIDEPLPSTSSSCLQSKTISEGKKRKGKLASKMKNSAALLDAVGQFDVLGHLLDDFGPQWVDPVKMERMHRINARTAEMCREMYEKFAAARQMGAFCDLTKSARPIMMQRFLEWLGISKAKLDPKLANNASTETVCALLLNFSAIEIVAILVESALICRREQELALAPPHSPSKNANPIPNNADDALSLHFYQEALRRNRGYGRRGDILFGNF